MMNEYDTGAESTPLQTGVASVPTVLVALLALFFGVDYVANGAMENDGYTQVLILPVVASLAAALGRYGAFASFGNLSQFRSAIVIFGFVAVAAVISIAYNLFESVGRIGALTFALVGISTFVQIRSGRKEEANILLSVVVGFHLAVSHAANSVLDSADWAGSAPDLIDTHRAAIASVFFAFWAVSIVVGMITTALVKGKLDSAGSGAFGASLSSSNKVLMYALLTILVIQAIPLVWLGQLTGIQDFANHMYLGSVWALFTTAVVLFVAFCHSERWNVIGALVAVNWLLYTLGHLQETGNEFPSFLTGDDAMSTFSWFFLGFWLNVAAIMIASRGYFGDISPRHEPSQARVWWQSNSYSIMVVLAIFVAFAIRTGWNVLPAMNASATGLWDMTGGSDPWYMKRVVDYIVAERSHYIFDHDRAYPMGAINPRPPLFSWSLALGGLSLSWLLEIPADEATWWSVAAMPAVFGALIVLPLAAIAKNIHSKGAGILTAWLIALMPGHISHATFGLADHDSFALLFLSMAFYYWVRALDNLGTERLFQNPSSSPLYLVAGIRETWHRNSRSMAFATLSGISFATVALGWKGFVYGPGILFLAYAGQIILNMFRKRDSLPLTSATLQMLLTSFLIPLPFYMWPGLNLVFDPSGFQPMFYIIGFTLALGWVASSFRDKPWLLVLGTGGLLIGGILAILYILQQLEYYNGWDILFTGGFYFSKNKIFGTIGEAQAPSRGVLFASYGPVVALIAVGCAFVLMWRGARRERQSHLLLGLWVVIATYMAWSAGRFIFNATPAMAVVGGIGLTMLWEGANFSSFVKEWRRSGIGTPRTRFRSIWPATKRNPAIAAILVILMMVASQHATYGIDSGIPRGEASASDVDQTIHDIAPDFLRAEVLGLSVLKSEGYNPESQLWYMGTFGPGFNSGSWNLAYDWLSEQDSDMSFSERPAFVSWWDYGFQALAQGQHPTVADNFQSGIPHSGGMLLSNSQEDTLALFITTIAQGDRRYSDGAGFTESFVSALSEHMTEEQLEEYSNILSIEVNEESFVLSRAMAIVATDDHTELMRGYSLDSEGLPEPDEKWVVMIGGVQMGNSTDNEAEALDLFNATRLNNAQFDMDTTHYLIGGYRYTSDLIEDFNDVSTGLHRANAKLAMSRAFLSTAFDMEELAAIYHDITGLEYEVQDYQGTLGETVVRNNDIRYFAIDNRLYPLGGTYYGDYQYHRGQTTGIFHAPTGLSGLDMEDYITAIYETQRGEGPIIPRSSDEFEEEYLNDIIRQSSGASDSNEIIRMVDIDYQQQPAFFETMVARFYVGYSTSMLGLPGDAEQPAPHFYTSGSPGSYLENAYPLPGAMMNHFVLANWYDDDRCDLLDNGSKVDENCSNPTIGSANTQVKIMKYYSGATLEGTVELEGFGSIPNARLMFERDAFSGEEVADADGHVVDGDDRTYWIPIGYTDADENGHFSYTVPAGKIRVSAFIGEPNLDAARSAMMTGDVGQSLSDIFQETSANRNVNPITGILANVSGATWLSETIVNVSGEAGHSNGEQTVYGNVSVEPSYATGKLVWSGATFFDQDPLTNVTVEISPSAEHVQIPPHSTTTSSGIVEGYDLAFGGIGEVTFTGEGSLISQGVVTVTDFTGNQTQTISHNHSLTGDGLFSGRGILSGNVTDEIEIPGCGVNSTMPENHSVCSLESGDFLIEGSVNATGRFTSNGSTSFTRGLSHATLVGSGVFVVDTSDDLDSYGTINGTFANVEGEGIFSGPMVQPGTFHFVDLIPGVYDISVIFSDGTTVDLEEQFIIPLIGSPDVTTVDIAGGAISGYLVNSTGSSINSTVALLDENSTHSDATSECSDSGFAPCLLVPDEDGFFQFGPIVPGNYTAQTDVDSDGFPELSEDYIFDPEIDIEYEFPSPVPETSDLTFTLTESGNPVPDLDVTLRLKNGTGDAAFVEYDNESGHYRAELSRGTWILNHTLSEDMQLWEQIEVGEDDIYAEYEFEVSIRINGTVFYDEDLGSDEDGPEEGKVLDYVQVDFHWEGFSTVAQTDGGGHFSVVLPQGAVIDATVQLPGAMLNLVNGTRFTVTSEGPSIDGETFENLTLLATPGYIVEGTVNINREDNPLQSYYGGWQPIVVTADNADTEVRWHASVMANGQFQMTLPGGNWTFDLDAEWIVSTPVDLEVNGKNDSIDIITSPVNSSVTVYLFLDHSADNNADNGTAVTFPFSIVDAYNSSRVVYEVLENGSEWTQDGLAELSLEPGNYRIEVETSNPETDYFGTRIMTGETRFDIGLLGGSIERSLGFDPEWRVNLTFTNESGGVLSGHLVKMTNTESGWVLSHTTDDEGRWNDHIPEGDWIVTIEPFGTAEGVKEILRELITSSSENAGDDISMSTMEVAKVELTLFEDYSGEPIEGIAATLTSLEGLGSVSFQHTDSSGTSTIIVAPGDWEILLNVTDGGERWILDADESTSISAIPGDNPALNLTAMKFVELGGNVFWDFNDDNSSNVGEGIFNATININGDGGNYTTTSDNSGDWSLFVPADTVWAVEVVVDGFSTESLSVAVSGVPNTVDTEMIAQPVPVQGTISYIDSEQLSLISDGVTLELIPVEGMVRETVTPDKEIVDGSWTGNWSAEVEPGNWILRVTHEEGNLIAMGLIEAEVVIGNSLNLEMTEGGWFRMDTEWLDYDGVTRTLADTGLADSVFIEGPKLIFNAGAGVRWVEEVNEEGFIEMLMIPGTIDASSEFDVSQRNLTMSYIGGQGVTVSPGQEAPPATLTHVRIASHEVSITTTNNSGGDPEFQGDSGNAMAISNSEGGFEPVEFQLSVDYLGHEPFDTFSIFGDVVGTDGTHWLVEFNNGSGDWNSTAEFDMGLDNAMNFSDLLVRVTPANQSTAHAFDNGHTISMTIVSKEDGYMKDHSVNVKIPQIHGFELTEPMEESYGIQPGQSINIGIMFTNSGNGDERYEFVFDDSELPEGWVRAGATSHTIGAYISSTHTVTVSAPANASEEDFTIYMSVRDKANNTYPDVEIHVQTSMPSLRISSYQNYNGGEAEAEAGQTVLYTVVVENTGLIDAQLVQLNGTLCDSYSGCPDTSSTGVIGMDTRDVPANSEVVFEIYLDMSEISPATYYLYFDINNTGFDSVEDYSAQQ
ncbi:MAG: STT3 domain-containing protein, partial [Candidatus Thermoplasmatota archaeon]|nr:STT3 domain-containing protein [Candidatus Thermoplasmatota archaeon]